MPKSDPVVLIDSDRTVIALNSAAEELTGQKNASIAGKVHCYELFHCQNDRGEPLRGCDCPGILGFSRHKNDLKHEYIVEEPSGEKVKVNSDYHFMYFRPEDKPLALIRMKPKASPRSATNQPELGSLMRPMPGWQVIGLTILLAAGFVFLGFLTDTTAHKWMTVGSISHGASQPVAYSFIYPDTVRSGAKRIVGTVFVTEVRESSATVLLGRCPYDGATVEWNDRLKAFVCPEDGSLFSRDGLFLIGQAGARLPQLWARVKSDSLWVRVPKSPGVPSKNQVPNDYPIL